MEQHRFGANADAGLCNQTIKPMKCVKCKSTELKPANLEQGLNCERCDDCGGSWVSLNNYMNWHDKNASQANMDVVDNNVNIDDSSTVLICPICNQIMGKFRVGAQITHRIDQCANCGGFWLDKGEWEYLKNFHLHTSINTIFTDTWQRKIREDTVKRNAEKRYLTKFGVVTYQQAKELREHLIGNPFKNRIIAYLMNPDPKAPPQVQPVNQSYCPKCSKLMARYRISVDEDIYVEQCDNCDGLWIAQDQWRNILRKNYSVDTVFVEHNNRQQESKVPYSEQYFEATFGKDLYKKTKAFKKTLERHESKLELISFLSKEDPYQA